MDFLTALTTLAPSIVAIVTVIFAYLQTTNNNTRQLQQLREQQQHEEKKAQLESEVTKDRYMKEQLREVYANATRWLSEVAIKSAYHQMSTANSKPQPNEVGEAQKWLSLFVVYYDGDKNDNEFKKFYNNIMYLSGQNGDQYAEPLRRYIIDAAMNDERLK
jgi:hypothetical protein